MRKICDEVFGAENFVSTFIWKSRQNKDNRNINGVSIDHEYILVYARNNVSRLFKGEKRNEKGYLNPDNDPLGPWTSANMAGIATESQRPNLHYDLINPETGINYGRPKMGWRYDKNTMAKLISEGRIIWPEDVNGRPRKKTYLKELDDNLPGFSSIIGTDVYTRNGSLEIDSIFDERLFSFPKPSNLIKPLIFQIAEKDSVILDFFSGSATTAHAVMQLNAEDGGKRKFIMVQLPELCDEKSEAYKAGYKNICEIGKERIRRAGQQILKQVQNDKDSLFADEKKKLDIGFRVLKCDSSNMEDVYYTPDHFDKNDLFKSNVKTDRTGEDLLFQVMLDLGIMLSSKIETKKIDGKTVFYVEGNYLVACFDENVDEKTITEIAKEKPYYFVMRDSSMANDSVATNFEQIFKTYSPETQSKVI